MGILDGLIRGGTAAYIGAHQGIGDRKKEEQRALHQALADSLLKAQIANYQSEAANRGVPKPTEYELVTDNDGNVQRVPKQGPEGRIPGIKGKSVVPPKPPATPKQDYQLVQNDNGDYVWIPKPTGEPAAPTPTAPTGDFNTGTPVTPGQGPVKPIATGVKSKLTEQQLAAGGQAEEAAKALEVMKDIERRSPGAADKAAAMAGAGTFGKAGALLAEGRNFVSPDQDAQDYYNANQQYRLAIASIRGNRGAQYLLDLERRATSRAVGESGQTTAKRQAAQDALINELRRKGRLPPTGGSAQPKAGPKGSGKTLKDYESQFGIGTND